MVPADTRKVELEAENAELKARIAKLEQGVVDPNLLRLAAQIPDNIMVVDLERRIQFINWTVPDQTAEAVLGTRPESYVPERDRARLASTYQHVLSTGEPRRIALDYVADDGSTTTWESRLTPIMRDAKVTGAVAVSTNITERDEPARDRDYFFHVSVDLLCVATLDGVLKRVSPAFTRTLGWDESELVDRSLTEFLHPGDVDVFRFDLARMAQSGTAVDVENRCRHKNGGFRTLHWRGVGLPERGLIYASARDMTEQRAIEQRLRHSQKMDAVGQLAGGLAHDFNNHLLAILINADYSLKHAESATVREHLEQVKRGAQHAAELTRQLLDFSRKPPLQLEQLDLNELVRDLLKMMVRTIPENIDLDFLPQTNLPRIGGDVGQLEQLLMNLCLNARDALPHGGRIQIETGAVTLDAVRASELTNVEPGRFVQLVVRDDGAGMTPEVMGRIFDPFFTTKPAGTGTGLGLATAYGIVERHRGAIDVRSQPNRGTTFTLYFRATDAVAATLPEQKERREPPGGTETVLIAEDAASVRRVVARALSHAGYRVIAASDGEDALALAKAHDDIALALLDVVMPKLGGKDTADALRAQLPNINILFTTGHSDRRSLRAELGNVQFVSKPYELDELLRRVRHAIDHP